MNTKCLKIKAKYIREKGGSCRYLAGRSIYSGITTSCLTCISIQFPGGCVLVLGKWSQWSSTSEGRSKSALRQGYAWQDLLVVTWMNCNTALNVSHSFLCHSFLSKCKVWVCLEQVPVDFCLCRRWHFTHWQCLHWSRQLGRRSW